MSTVYMTITGINSDANRLGYLLRNGLIEKETMKYFKNIVFIIILPWFLQGCLLVAETF